MLRGIWGDNERYVEQYWSRWPDVYFAGDGAKHDREGHIWLLGRVDDVMNVSGHRISTAEVESALVSHDAIAEAAVVGANDDTTAGNRRVRDPASACRCVRGTVETFGPMSPRRSVRSRSRSGSWWSTNPEDSLRKDHAAATAGCCGKPLARRRLDTRRPQRHGAPFPTV